MVDMFMVTYTDWDDFRVNSVWFDEDLAGIRAEELNKKQGRSDTYWEVEEIELGDPK